MNIFCTALIVVGCTSILSLNANTSVQSSEAQCQDAERAEMPVDSLDYWENTPCPGMYFSSANVTEEYEYDDAYCIRYTDPDANMVECEIVVDLETYQLIIESVKSGEEMVGQLVLNDDYSDDTLSVFTYISDPEW